MKRLSLFGLLCFMVVISMFGCSTTQTSGGTATPPAGTTTIEVGSGGGATGEAGSTTGAIYTVVLDQASTPLTNLLSGNVKITIWVTGEVTAECAVVTVTNHSGSTAQAITYAMTLDRSGSMYPEDIASLETAASTFIDNTGSSDQGAILNFASYVKIDQGLTTDKSLLTWAVTNESTDQGSTALYDSIGTAVSTAAAGANSRKAAIAMTDGGENNSVVYLTTAEVIAHATANGIPVYCVGLGSALYPGSYAEQNLQSIATGTGGFYYYAPSAEALATMYSKITAALNDYYTISYTLPSGWTFTAGHTYYITFQVQNYGGLTGSYTFPLTI